MSEWRAYRRKGAIELRPYVEDEDIGRVWLVSVSDADHKAGSPKVGDWIARNPANHADQWLVAADYFAEHYEPLIAPPEVCDVCGDQFSDLAGHKALGVQTHPWLLAGTQNAQSAGQEKP